MSAETGRAKSRSRGRKRRSLRNAAWALTAGVDGCVNSQDSLWTKTAPGMRLLIARIANTLALQALVVAVTKAASVLRHSFHQPYFAEKRVVTSNSLTGVQN